jgi:putative aldouronate transport system substrate-binding protein
LKKLKQALCITLSSVLILGALSGCGTNNSLKSSSTPATTKVPDTMNAVGTYPITKEKITVKAMVGTNSQMAKDWNTMEAFKKLETLTNIHWDFDYVVTGDSSDNNYLKQLSIRMASGDLPEVCLLGGMTSDTEESYGKAGKLVDLTNLINKYAPHLKKLRDSNKQIRLSTTASDGKIYGLPYYAESSANVATLDFFDQKYMENVGITKVPSTTDELYTMLKAFKEKDMNKDGKSDDIALSTQGVGSLRITLQTAFQGYTGGSVSDEWDVDAKGTVVYLPEQKGYKEYLEYCHKLYQEGLLDNDFATQKSDQLSAKVQSGKVGIYLGVSPTTLSGTALQNDKQVCLPPLTSPTNSKKVTQAPNYLTTPAGFITTACKNKEAVMSWFDLFYRTETESIQNFNGKTSLLGFEGEQWKYTDSAKTQYSFIDPVKNYVQLNQTIMITFGLPAYISNTAVQTGSSLMQDKIQGNKDTKAAFYKEAFPIHARYTKDESDKESTLITDLDNYQSMMEAKFITGQADLSTFSDFITNLDKYGAKDLQKIQQQVYNRYAKAK